MFKKKKCNNCGEKINDKFEFCPSCGSRLNSNSNSKDWGMLGKNDLTQHQDPFSNSLFPGIGGNMLGKMLNNAMKMLENELQKEMKQKENNNVKNNFELYLNGKKINPENIKVTKVPIKKTQKVQKETREFFKKIFNQKQKEKFKTLPREEPETNIRRLSDTVIYELKMPGVKSKEDVAISQFENSIEIKAIGNKKSYFKIINLSYPIVDFYLEKGNLIIELENKN